MGSIIIVVAVFEEEFHEACELGEVVLGLEFGAVVLLVEVAHGSVWIVGLGGGFGKRGIGLGVEG